MCLLGRDPLDHVCSHYSGARRLLSLPITNLSVGSGPPAHRTDPFPSTALRP